MLKATRTPKCRSTLRRNQTSMAKLERHSLGVASSRSAAPDDKHIESELQQSLLCQIVRANSPWAKERGTPWPRCCLVALLNEVQPSPGIPVKRASRLGHLPAPNGLGSSLSKTRCLKSQGGLEENPSSLASARRYDRLLALPLSRLASSLTIMHRRVLARGSSIHSITAPGHSWFRPGVPASAESDES